MSSEIALDLNALGNANSINYKDFFYQHETDFVFRRLFEHASHAKKLLKTCCSEPQNDHFDAMTIVGDRGAGKTTFLKTICAISHTPDQLDQVKSNLKISHSNIETDTDILFLDILDPSILENCEIFLAIIVASITNAVENKKYHCHQADDLRTFKRVKFKLSKMFNVLFHDSAKDRWANMDDELLSQELTNFTNQGLMIGRTFNEFVCEALNVLKKDLLVLPIDDADTKFNKGYEILETVRKYLTTPFLIPIVSCDLKLFELVLKNKYYADSSHLSNASDDDLYHTEINTLATQYLEKILNPNDRINLYPIADYLTMGDCRNLKIKYHTEMCITETYKIFFKQAFNQETDILNPSLNNLAHIIPTNNRLLINSLKSIMDFNQSMASNNIQQAFHELFNSYSSNLKKYKLTGQDLFLLYKTNSENSVASLILPKIRLVEFGHLDAKYSSADNKTENIIALLLKMVLTVTYRNNMSRFLDYMLLIQEITFSLHERLSKVGSHHTLPFESHKDIIAHYITETQLKMNITTRDRMSRHIIYLYNNGFFPARDLKNNIGNGWQIVNPQDLPTLNVHSSIQHSIAMQNIGLKSIMINPYRFLGAVSDILKIISNHQDGYLKQDLFNYLQGATQLRYFDSGPESLEDDTDDNIAASSLPEITQEMLKDLTDEIVDWGSCHFEGLKLNDDLGILTRSIVRYRRNIQYPKFKKFFITREQANNFFFLSERMKLDSDIIEQFILNNKLVDGWNDFDRVEKENIFALLIDNVINTLDIVSGGTFSASDSRKYQHITATLEKSLRNEMPAESSRNFLKAVESMFYTYIDVKFSAKNYLTHAIYLFLFALYKEESIRDNATSSTEYATEFTLDKDDNTSQYSNKDVNDLYDWIKDKGKQKTYRLSYMLARFPLMAIGFNLNIVPNET